MNKDKEKIEHFSYYSHLEDIEIPMSNYLTNIYYPTWSNTPKNQTSLITFKGQHLLSKGGIFCLCAKAGIGKSSLMEAFVSSYLNPNADSFGVNINLPKGKKKILYLDTERTNWEVHKAWSKMMKRAGIYKSSSLTKKVLYAGLKKLSVAEKKLYVEDIVSKNEDIGLVVFDGCSDFVMNTNDAVESTNFINWIEQLGDEIGCAFTIHTNPNDNKARGWLGSELLRKCESMLLAKRDGDDFELTADFENGKVRHGSKPSQSYKWCEIEEMFVSTTHIPTSAKEENEIKKDTLNRELVIKIWGGEHIIIYSEMLHRLMRELGKNKEGAINFYKTNLKGKLIQKVGGEGWEIMGLNNGVK